MSITEKRHILLCVAGGTPQIITETLWAVMQRGERVDEIRVITTLEGRKKVRQLLLDEKEGKFHQFRRDFPEAEGIKFGENSLYLLTKRGAGVPSPRDSDEDRLEDLLTDDDNDRAADQICEIVRELTQDQSQRIHASVAGGRKTMGIYLTAAMQLFGRFDDALSHVLVSPKVENNPEFFYKPPTPEVLFDRSGAPLKTADGRDYTTDDAEIFLAEIPFIRLQGAQSPWLRDTKRSYGESVKQAQAYLNAAEANLSLKINLISGEVAIGETAAVLTGYELLLYTLFAEKRLTGAGVGRDGFLKLRELQPADFESALEKITGARGDKFGLERCQYPGEWHFLATVMQQAVSKNEKDYEDFSESVIRAIGRANKKLKAGRVPELYEIMKKGSRRPHTYGLDVVPERIIFVEEQVE